MNHVFNVVWNDALQAWQAISEAGGSARKKSKSPQRRRALRLSFMAVAAGVAGQAWAQLPTGSNITAGQGSVSVNGNTMTIQQHSQRMVTDWQSFSVGAGKTVEFVQPSSSAAVLNRVLGTDVSTIQGSIRANGQVFLLNPNGVLFTPTAQVNVGGLVASTLALTNDDFMAGRLRFSGNSAASVVNQGQIKAADGGAVALVAARIVNEGAGQVTADKGQVLMGAGADVTLDLGGPVKVKVNQGALNALIEQGAAVQADGGLVYMTAKAAGDLAATVINHTGVTRARTLATGERGSIYLMGGMVKDRIRVDGRLDASAPAVGNGGFVETSAARVQMAEGLRVDTRSASGQTGNWLIDPNDYTVKASGGDITGAALGSQLDTTNVTIQTATQGTAGGSGDINILDPISKSAGSNSNTTLTLLAERNITIRQSISGAANSPLNLVLSARATGAAEGSVEIVGGLPDGVTSSSNSQPYSTIIRTYGGDVTIGGGDATASGYAIRGDRTPDAYSTASSGQGGVRIYNGAVIDASSDGGTTLSVSNVNNWQGNHFFHYASAGSTSGLGGNVTVRGQGNATNVTYNWGVQIQNGSIATAGAGKISIEGEGGNGGSSATSGPTNSWNVGSIGVLLERSANLLAQDGDINIVGRAGTGYDRYGIASTESNKQIKTGGYLKMDGDSLLIRDGTLTLDVGRDSDIKAPIVGCAVSAVGCGTYALTKTGVGILNLWGDAEAWNSARPANTRATATNGTFTDSANKVNLIVPGVDPSTLVPSVIGAKKLYAFTIPAALDLALMSASSATPLTIYYVRALPSGSSVYGDTPAAFTPLFAIYNDKDAGTEVTLATTGSAVWSNINSISATSNAGTYAVTYAGGLRSATSGAALMPGAASSVWQVTPRAITLEPLSGFPHTKVWGQRDSFLAVYPTEKANVLNYPQGNPWAALAMTRVPGEAPGQYATSLYDPQGFALFQSLNPNYSFSTPAGVFTITPKVINLTGTYTKKWGRADPELINANVASSQVLRDQLYSSLILPQLVRAAGETAGTYAIDMAGLTAALKAANGNVEYITFTGNASLKIESAQGLFMSQISKVFPLTLPKVNTQLPSLKSLGEQISVAVTGIKISVPKISLPKVKLFSFF